MTRPTSSVADVIQRPIILVCGKGGVGKTSVSEAIARSLAVHRQKKTLWVTIEDPLSPPGEVQKLGPSLDHLNCEATVAFEEYVQMKIGMATLTKIFLQNKLIRYMAKAAPGIHEIVLLGKIWNERHNYQHIVVDMPSTGYGLAMFQSTANFSKLFQGGPIQRDADAMLDTFRDPVQSGSVIVALPEEMPLRESLELDDFLQKIFPGNPSSFLVNRTFPHASTQQTTATEGTPDDWSTPVPATALDYVRKRIALEQHNLRLWRSEGIEFAEIGYVAPPPQDTRETVVSGISNQLAERGYA